MVTKLAFVGAGSMAEAIIAGVLANGFLTSDQIYVTNKNNLTRLERLCSQYQVNCSSDKREVLEGADIVVLSMKPKDIKEALQSIKPYLNTKQLIVSVLAGISSDYIAKELGVTVPIVRAMPNTSAAIGFSATALAKGEFATDAHFKNAQKLFQTIGTATLVEEEDLHAVTGLSGSGPAYIYYLVEAMENAAIEAGLKQEVSKELIIQTLVGAAEMLKTSKDEPAVLRQKVTSPGGTTQAGLETLEKYKYQEALIECIKNAKNRSIELGKPYEIL
jgi:pyrroline-5-carboxylate reductase